LIRVGRRMGLALELTFLTGRIAAKRLEDEEAVEWPPHPARVFSALAAAYFEAGEGSEERALEWLENRDPPAIWVSGEPAPTRLLDVYVPVNDPTGLAVFPAYRGQAGGRQLRRFASAFVGDATVTYGWATSPDPTLREALAGLCARVASVGHSSSLVRLLPVAPPAGRPTWTPAQRGRLLVRVPFPGMLESLRRGHERYLRAGIRGAVPAVLQPYEEIPPDPAPVRAGIARGAFEGLWILRKLEGPELPAIAAPAVASALRRAVLALWSEAAGGPPDAPIPEEVTGRGPNGEPLERPHVGWLAFPAVGHPRSSGHLLGLGVALPRGLLEGVRAALWRVLTALQVLHLRPGSWRLELVGRLPASDLPLNLQAWRWCRPARIWASVTPVVLDRYPDELFGSEAEADVRLACLRASLPEPEEVVLRPTALVPGAPPARQFPPYPPGSPSPRVHAVLAFRDPVAGPVLLGRGRYRGLGLFLPLGE